DALPQASVSHAAYLIGDLILSATRGAAERTELACGTRDEPSVDGFVRNVVNTVSAINHSAIRAPGPMSAWARGKDLGGMPRVLLTGVAARPYILDSAPQPPGGVGAGRPIFLDCHALDPLPA